MVFDAIGGFRHGLPEDTDWCRRAVAAGYVLRFAPEACVAHPARHDWSELVAKWDRLVSEKYNAMRSQPLFAPRWVILALLTGASILPHGVRLLLGRENAGWRRRLAAVGVLARIRLWRTRRMLALLGSPS
jgi:GT2 family glycosyltransferase